MKIKKHSQNSKKAWETGMHLVRPIIYFDYIKFIYYLILGRWKLTGWDRGGADRPSVSRQSHILKNFIAILVVATGRVPQIIDIFL